MDSRWGGGIIAPLLMEATSGLNTWTTKPLTGVTSPLYGIAYGAGKWITVGDNTILNRTTANTWSPITGFPANTALYDVVYANNQFIAVGADGAILTSPDGDAWTKLDSKTTKHLYRIAAYRE